MRDYDLRDRTTSAVLAEKAARIGERPFLHWDGKTFTYGDLEELTNRYANGLLDLGVQRGDHVALLLENGPEFLWALWGLGKIGAVAVPLNTAAKGAMLQYFLDHSDSVALIAAGELLPRVNEVVGELSKLRTVVGHGISEAELAEMITMPGLRLATTSDLAAAPAAKPESEEAVAWNDPHLILFTSGTTGPSKGVVSPHAQGHAVGRQMARFNGYTSEDVLYTCLPVFHGNALWYTVYAALWADASVALYPHFSARRFWDQVRESRATVFNCLGAMANIVWQQPRTSLDQEHSVRLCMLVPNSKALAVGFRERYNIGVTSVYAMTENCAVTVFTTDDPIEKAPSAGRVRQDVAVRIVGDDGQPLPPGPSARSTSVLKSRDP